MTFIEEKIRMTVENLLNRIVTDTKGVDDIRIARCGYKVENKPADDLAYEPYAAGTPIAFKRDEHACIRFEADVPEAAADERWYLRMTTGKEGQWDAQNPQCTVFVDDEFTAVQAFDTNHTEMPVTPGRHTFTIYFYAGMSDCSLIMHMYFIRKNMTVDCLYWDMKVPYEALSQLDKNGYPYQVIRNALDETCLLLDFRTGGEPFLASVKAAQDYLTREFYEKACGKDEYTGKVSLIGHTHIDVAWLWTLAQTAEKAQRSFSTVIRLMEDYPEYVFMSSQPQLYAYVKENDPALYEKIKARVKEGRFEPEGAMWLEADTNLVSGESLIRQILYGKKFMKEELGADNHILWLPDVFGYSAALPQILKKCGVDTFFTSKISWSETDTFPHDNFIWKGIDGSEVFAVLGDNYVKRVEPRVIADTMKKHVDKKYSATHLSTFGFGDGGGGPTKEMLENYRRLHKGLPGFPKVEMRRASETLAEVKAQFDETAEKVRFVPKWSGELYLEMHRGTYTTMAKNKKYNRKSEFLYQKLETAAATAGLLLGTDYPRAAIDDAWHTILKNQFHDIIPGSSIREVYEDSHAEYAALAENGEALFGDAVDRLASAVKTDGGLFVYNPAGFTRSEVVEGADGRPVFVKDVPPHGFAVVKPETVAEKVFADEKHVENDKLCVTFDEKYHIVSVFDKKAGREVIAAGEKANVFEVYEDYPRAYDAWEITEYYKQKKWIADDVTAVEVVNEGVRAGVRVTRKYGASTFVQYINLRAGNARLDFETAIDWHEDHVLLKAAFPFDIHAEEANCNIQFGHIARPTHRNTSWDEAKFEICAHKWLDLSEACYGAAIMSDCKYGYSLDENVVRLSLLKAPTYPNPVADRGENTFTYALYPHEGDLAASDVTAESYALNLPMTVKSVAANADGKIADRFAFVCADKASAVVETVKCAEDGEGTIVRVYDACGGKKPVTLTFGFDAKSVNECDMLENDGEALAVKDNSVSFVLGAFEVKTLRVK